jgi:hypothetical protein
MIEAREAIDQMKDEEIGLMVGTKQNRLRLLRTRLGLREKKRI